MHDVYIFHVNASGTAFGMDERERLGLRGLLPPVVSTMHTQVNISDQLNEHS